MSSRSVPLSIRQLEVSEHDAKCKLASSLNVVNSVDFDRTTELSIRDVIAQIKDKKVTFERASPSLSDWHTSHGSPSAAREIRNERVQLIHIWRVCRHCQRYEQYAQ